MYQLNTRLLCAISLIGSSLVISACGTSQTQLDRVGPPTERIDGVEIRTAAPEWPGPRDITTEVTPVRMTIDNGSDVPLRFRYSEIALVAPGGEEFEAIPPYYVEGTVADEVTAEITTPVSSPAFIYDGFLLAPYYSVAYPGLVVYTDPFAFDPLYYDQHFTYWEQFTLPTETMLQFAIPEGVIQPGGSIEGWIYFEHVDDDLAMVTLEAELVNAETEQTFGEIEVPYRVE